MTRSLTRRELGIVMAAASAVGDVGAQTPPTEEKPDLLKQARDLNARNSQTLAKLDIPISTEPAFQFKA